MIRALLWDVDGTLAETERDGHRVAFNRAFADAGVPWRWDEHHYGQLLRITGGRERLVYDMQRENRAPQEPAAREALAATLHRLKNAHYLRIVQDGQVHLRAGVVELLEDCAHARVLVGIVTTTSRGNVEGLLGHHLGRDWSARFATVVCAEQAPRKKPDPQAYLLALQELGLPASQTLAIEDSAAGVEAAQRAGVPVIVTPSYYFPTPPPDVLASGPSLGRRDGWVPTVQAGTGRIDLKQLARWHQQHAATSPGNLALRR